MESSNSFKHLTLLHIDYYTMLNCDQCYKRQSLEFKWHCFRNIENLYLQLDLILLIFEELGLLAKPTLLLVKPLLLDEVSVFLSHLLYDTPQKECFGTHNKFWSMCKEWVLHLFSRIWVCFSSWPGKESRKQVMWHITCFPKHNSYV